MTTTVSHASTADDATIEAPSSRKPFGVTARLLALLATLGCAVAMLATPASAAAVGGVSVGAVAEFESCPQTVGITPFSAENVGSNYTVWARASVYETGRGWVTSAYYRVNGTTTITFYGVNREPYAWAYLAYARYVNGAWRYATEYVRISDALDNGFCPVS